MSEEQKTEAENVEVTDPPDNSTQVSEAESQAVQEQDQAQRPSAPDQERNWKAQREKQERLERKNAEKDRQIAELTSALKEVVAGKQPAPPPEPEEDDSDIPTVGQTKKIIERKSKKAARQELEEFMAEQRQKEAPDKLKREFSDFNEVVTTENVDYLINNEPEMAALLDKSKDDLYAQGKVAYKFIKNLGLHKKDSVEAMKQDASRNAEKPVSPNAVASRNSVGDANIFARGLTADLKKHLHQEMVDAIKRR